MSARSTRHPFTQALYQLQADGNVGVTDALRQGLFTPEGRWISGVLRECDPQMCVWIANNPQLPQGAMADSHITDAKRDGLT